MNSKPAYYSIADRFSIYFDLNTPPHRKFYLRCLIPIAFVHFLRILLSFDLVFQLAFFKSMVDARVFFFILSSTFSNHHYQLCTLICVRKIYDSKWVMGEGAHKLKLLWFLLIFFFAYSQYATRSSMFLFLFYSLVYLHACGWMRIIHNIIRQCDVENVWSWVVLDCGLHNYRLHILYGTIYTFIQHTDISQHHKIDSDNITTKAKK